MWTRFEEEDEEEEEKKNSQTFLFVSFRFGIAA